MGDDNWVGGSSRACAVANRGGATPEAGRGWQFAEWKRNLVWY